VEVGSEAVGGKNSEVLTKVIMAKSYGALA